MLKDRLPTASAKNALRLNEVTVIKKKNSKIRAESTKQALLAFLLSNGSKIWVLSWNSKWTINVCSLVNVYRYIYF